MPYQDIYKMVFLSKIGFENNEVSIVKKKEVSKILTLTLMLVSEEE